MKTALAVLAAIAALLACGWFATTSSGPTVRGLAAAFLALVSFLLGIGCGERSRAAFDASLLRINRLLGEQNDALREANLHLLHEQHESESISSADGETPLRIR